jgi:hypothetical protein
MGSTPSKVIYVFAIHEEKLLGGAGGNAVFIGPT